MAGVVLLLLQHDDRGELAACRHYLSFAAKPRESIGIVRKLRSNLQQAL